MLVYSFYQSWDRQRQEDFLNFCSGMKGCKMLYDSFFKQVMDPTIHPERLSGFLSHLLKREVRILQVLPNESRMTAEDSLLIMDIVVEMEDGRPQSTKQSTFIFSGAREAGMEV